MRMMAEWGRLSILAGLLVSACEAEPTENGAQGTDNAQGSGQHASPRQREQRIDLRPLLGADKRAVARLLGEPTSCRRESRGEGCAYGRFTEAGEATEIFFINGRAANLTLPNYGLAFEPASLQAYGIDAGEPVFRNAHVIRWHTIIGSTPVEVNMFPGEQDRIFYLYVMARN